MNIQSEAGKTRYQAEKARYDTMQYRRCGNSGIKLPALSLGCWHNFGNVDNQDTADAMLTAAFDLGIIHFDLANNYGPPYGSAEENFGKIFKRNFAPYRDELFVSSKAGYDMWPGPYGDFGSRKYLMASLDQSLKRLQLDYVDLFYHHRPDPETPLEETMLALADIVRQGKALYVGISNYQAEETEKAATILAELNAPFIIHQARYSILDRWVENGLLDVLSERGLGCIAFSPLAQGLLTEKYLNGIPKNSRAAKDSIFLDGQAVAANLNKIRSLVEIAKARGQKLSQMAIAWLLSRPAVVSVLIGASSVEQLKENVASLDNLVFSEQELKLIDSALKL